MFVRVYILDLGTYFHESHWRPAKVFVATIDAFHFVMAHVGIIEISPLRAPFAPDLDAPAPE